MNDNRTPPDAGDIVPFPPRPPVGIGGQHYAIVEPQALRGLLDDLGRFIYAQTHLALADRHRWFARVAAAAAVNAVLDS